MSSFAFHRDMLDFIFGKNKFKIKNKESADGFFARNLNSLSSQTE